MCFVGYSINDPVLRYMMDALAADRLLGESPPESFAFGSHSKGKETERANEWRAKNVTPILYREHWRHAYLHKTLRAWAAIHRDGVRGKERIVVDCATAHPLASTKQDDFVSRVLWALSDPTGLPAKRFAELDPVPSLDWLAPLSEDRFHHGDLARFGIPPKAATNDNIAFSLTCRPSPYDLPPFMTLADAGAHRTRWDQVMQQLARWLIRHLDDPALLLWVARQGGQLHGELAQWIEGRIDYLANLERGGTTVELERIRANAPSAIPRPAMRTLWRMLLSGRVESQVSDPDLFQWRRRFAHDGLTTTLRLELREQLTPRVSLREPLPWPTDDDDVGGQEHIDKLVESQIVLSTNHVDSALRELSKDQRWYTALPELLSDFSGLLHDALDLMRELGDADGKRDLSYVHQPSISEDPRNGNLDDWTVLIDLTRDAWLAMAAQSPEQAGLAADAWWQIPYPLFRRLSFFAAAQNQMIPSRHALDWLLADDGWWLWSVETEHEAIRLLVALTPLLNEAELVELEQAILAGPPRTIFQDDIEPEDWTWIRDRDTWLRLAKLDQTSTMLSVTGKKRLVGLAAQHPDWGLDEDERDDDGSGRWRKFVVTPRRRRELVEWLKEHPNTDHWQKDDWRQRCRDNFATTACALCALGRERIWPTDRWRDALDAWLDEKLIQRSWRRMASVLSDIPQETLQKLIYRMSWWLRAIAKEFKGQDDKFFALCNRVLALEYEGDDDDNNVIDRAIKHPVGHVTEALLRWWYRRSLEDGQGLPAEVKPTFTELCDTRLDKFRHGRILLTAHVVALFRVDPDWAKRYLLPLFHWKRSELEARAAWEGFLWSPRLYQPLMEVLKPAFLDTALHYAALRKHSRQYAGLLTFAALEPGDVFTKTELAAATRKLPQDGLRNAAAVLVRALEGAGSQRADYWMNRVAPYLHTIWPKTVDYASVSIAESLGRVCVAAQDAFPDAVGLLRPWLRTLPFPGRLVHPLHEAGSCEQFPEPALDFLDLIIGDETQQPSNQLGNCLESIRTAEPSLEHDPRYKRLMEYLRQHGGGPN